MSFRNTALLSGVFFVCLRVIAASGLAASEDARQGPNELALMFIQASARLQINKANGSNVEAPRMYVCEGCDGSTATMEHAVNILALHGIDAGEPTEDREFLMRAHPLEYFNSQYRKKGQTLVFKSILHRDADKTLIPSVKNMGTMSVYVTRKNKLDHLVCMIRDCFWTNVIYGYPVDEAGRKSNLCFERRTENEGKNYKAKIELLLYPWNPSAPNPPTRSRLLDNLNKVESLATEAQGWLKKAGFTGPTMYYEDLCAFERGGVTNVETSLKYWVQLLEAWGVNADQVKVRAYLNSKEGTWKQQTQEGEIANYQDVVRELKRIGRKDLIREW